METIAIIGGGFSGTMAAVNLVRFSDRPLLVRLINRGYPLGRGVAYSTRRAEHLLNVVARNMSALPDHPNHFLNWLRTRVEYADTPEPTLRETFVPRRVYGDYLRSLSFSYFNPVEERPVRVETVADEAVDVLVDDNGARVILAGGGEVEAARVLLATGNQPPAPLPSPAAPFRHPAYVDNPWTDLKCRLPGPNENVILLGTGLTAVDAFLTLAVQGWQGTIHAISRNALLPRSHFWGIEYPDFPPAKVDTLGLAALVSAVEDHCGRLRQLGVNPAIVVDKLRPHTQHIWQAFSLEEKQEFCRRHAARWNVTRHRIPEPIHGQLMESVATGRLNLHAGRVTALEEAGSRVRVTFNATDSQQKSLEGALVINCTGPQTGFSAVDMPLFRNMLSRGTVRADELDMGIDVDGDFAVLGRDGRRSKSLYAIGPLLKGTLWETTAVPELRGQAMRIAQTLLEDMFPASAKLSTPLANTIADVIEYCI